MTYHFKLTLSVFIVFSSSNSFAQMITHDNDLFGGAYGIQEKEYIEGSRYLNDDFIIGDIYYDDSLQITEIPLRLNLHNDELEFLQYDSVYAIAQPYRIDKVVLGNDDFIYINHHTNAEISGYVKLWNVGYPMLITKMRVDCYKKVSGQAFVESHPDRFERAPDKQYLVKSENEIIEITSTKKLIKLLEDHAQELTTFAKERKISGKDPAPMAKLLNYYHTIQQNL